MTFLITTWADRYNTGPRVLHQRVQASSEPDARRAAYETHRLSVTPSFHPEITIVSCEEEGS